MMEIIFERGIIGWEVVWGLGGGGCPEHPTPFSLWLVGVKGC